jgi:GNAT superfamily N-acetyltransferase
MQKIVIRQANVLDYVKVIRLITEAKDPPGVRVGRLNGPKIQQFILTSIQFGYMAVADLGGNIVAVMGCSAWTPPWSNDTVLNLEFCYVQPAHRAGGVPRMLLANVLREARRANVELRLLLADRDVKMIGEQTIRTSGLRDAARMYILGRQDENAGLPSAGSAAKRNDVDLEPADDGSDPVPARSVREDEPEPDGSDDLPVPEPPEDWG